MWLLSLFVFVSIPIENPLPLRQVRPCEIWTISRFASSFNWRGHRLKTTVNYTHILHKTIKIFTSLLFILFVRNNIRFLATKTISSISIIWCYIIYQLAWLHAHPIRYNKQFCCCLAKIKYNTILVYDYDSWLVY